MCGIGVLGGACCSVALGGAIEACEHTAVHGAGGEWTL